MERKDIVIVLIGSTRSLKDEKITPIPNVLKNIEELRKVFQEPTIAGVSDNDIYSILDCTKQDSIEQLFRICRNVGYEKLLLVYYAGHGVPGEDAQLYLTASDSQLDMIMISGIRAGEIANIIKGCRAKRKVLILDSCYSGAILGTMTPDEASTATLEMNREDYRGVYAMASASNLEQARFDATNPNSPTYFTGALLEVLKEGLASENDHISVDELFQEVRDRLLKEGLPRPVRKVSDDAGKFLIARNRKYKPKAPKIADFSTDDLLQLSAAFKQAGDAKYANRDFKGALKDFKNAEKLLPNQKDIENSIRDCEQKLKPAKAKYIGATLNSSNNLTKPSTLDLKNKGPKHLITEKIIITPDLKKENLSSRHWKAFLTITILTVIIISVWWIFSANHISPTNLSTGDSIVANKTSVPVGLINTSEQSDSSYKTDTVHISGITTEKNVDKQLYTLPKAKTLESRYIGYITSGSKKKVLKFTLFGPNGNLTSGVLKGYSIEEGDYKGSIGKHQNFSGSYEYLGNGKMILEITQDSPDASNGKFMLTCTHPDGTLYFKELVGFWKSLNGRITKQVHLYRKNVAPMDYDYPFP